MLSLEQCRRLIPSQKSLSDLELTNLCAQLYGLSDIAITAFLGSKKIVAVQTSNTLTDIQREALEERAAIMEFDGKLPRPIARRIASENLGLEGAL